MEASAYPAVKDLKRIRSLSQFNDEQLASLAEKLPPVQSLPAFAKLGMGELGMEQIVEFLNQSRAEIEAIEANLAAA